VDDARWRGVYGSLFRQWGCLRCRDSTRPNDLQSRDPARTGRTACDDRPVGRSQDGVFRRPGSVPGSDVHRRAGLGVRNRLGVALLRLGLHRPAAAYEPDAPPARRGRVPDRGGGEAHEPASRPVFHDDRDDHPVPVSGDRPRGDPLGLDRPLVRPRGHWAVHDLRAVRPVGVRCRPARRPHRAAGAARRPRSRRNCDTDAHRSHLCADRRRGVRHRGSVPVQRPVPVGPNGRPERHCDGNRRRRRPDPGLFGGCRRGVSGTRRRDRPATHRRAAGGGSHPGVRREDHRTRWRRRTALLPDLSQIDDAG